MRHVDKYIQIIDTTIDLVTCYTDVVQPYLRCYLYNSKHEVCYKAYARQTGNQQYFTGTCTTGKID